MVQAVLLGAASLEIVHIVGVQEAPWYTSSSSAPSWSSLVLLSPGWTRLNVSVRPNLISRSRLHGVLHNSRSVLSAEKRVGVCTIHVSIRLVGLRGVRRFTLNVVRCKSRHVGCSSSGISRRPMVLSHCLGVEIVIVLQHIVAILVLVVQLNIIPGQIGQYVRQGV